MNAAIVAGLATVFATCSTRTVAGVVADWWTVEIATASDIETVKFVSLQDLEMSLSGIKNALHSMGYLVELDWEALGHGFHAHAVNVDLPAKPNWAMSAKGVADRDWSYLGSEESEVAALRHFELNLLPNHGADDAGVWISQKDTFTDGHVFRGPATLAVNVDQYDMSVNEATALAAAIKRAAEILGREDDSYATDTTGSAIAGGK